MVLCLFLFVFLLLFLVLFSFFFSCCSCSSCSYCYFLLVLFLVHFSFFLVLFHVLPFVLVLVVILLLRHHFFLFCCCCCHCFSCCCSMLPKLAIFRHCFLTDRQLQDNQLTGSIPPSVGSLKAITFLCVCVLPYLAPSLPTSSRASWCLYSLLPPADAAFACFVFTRGG
jgi:hypothetical protein